MSMLGSNSPQKKTVEIDVVDEIDMIMKLMVEYSDHQYLLNVEKKFISEADYNRIWTGVTDVIIDTTTDIGEKEGLSQHDTFRAISKRIKLANRIIDNLYKVDWIY